MVAGGAALGRSVWLGPFYAASPALYNNAELRTGAPDRLLEQAVAWAAGNNNSAPTAVVLSNTTPTLPENTSTATRIKMADVVVTDDGIGTNTLTLASTDMAFFELDAGVLYLKASTVLDFETKPSYSVTVVVDDSSVGATPDATAVFTLHVTDENEPVVLTRMNATVTGNVQSTLTNTGTWSDPESEAVTLSASLGTVTKNVDGTWSWAHTPSVALLNQVVTISASDGTNDSNVTFNVTAFTTIATRGIQYLGATARVHQLRLRRTNKHCCLASRQLLRTTRTTVVV